MKYLILIFLVILGCSQAVQEAGVISETEFKVSVYRRDKILLPDFEEKYYTEFRMALPDFYDFVIEAEGEEMLIYCGDEEKVVNGYGSMECRSY